MYIQDLIAKTYPSRISLTYATTINGEPEIVALPFRMLVLGDFSRKSSSRPTLPLEERPSQRLTGDNLDDVLRAMSLTLQLAGVPDKVGTPPRMLLVTCTAGGPLGTAAFTAQVGADKPVKVTPTKADGRWTVDVADPKSSITTTLVFDDDAGEFRADDRFIVTPASKALTARTNVGSGELTVLETNAQNTISVRLPLTGMASFTPDEIARNVPCISALRRVKQLLLEMQADLDNRRGLRAKLNEMLGSADLKKTLRGGLTYQQLRLLPGADTPAPAPAPPAGGAPAAPPDPIDLAPFDLEFAADTDQAAPAATAGQGSKSDALVAALRAAAGLDGPPGALPTLTASLDELDNPTLSADAHFLARLAALLNNVYVPAGKSLNKSRVLDAIGMLDDLVNVQMNEILHHPDFKQMAAAWGALENLVDNTDFSEQIHIDVLDVSQEELQADFDSSRNAIFSGALFKKVYIDEYDQYGGLPYGALIGLYEFGHTPADLRWLRHMAKIANASHAPFLAAASPAFFGCRTPDEVAAIKDIRNLVSQLQYGDWNDFRDQPEAAYLGLALPRFMLRQPWDQDTNPCSDLATFSERVDDTSDSYLWGNPAILVARNLLRSFNESGWCQYLRGPKGGGRITALPAAFYQLHDHEVVKSPVEITIPDYREFAFAASGFIPLILKKDSTEATFFSVQSAKRPARFKDDKDNQNAELVCNLAYTFSITRIAHYVKCIMRDNIGSAADAPYIQQVLSTWLSDYVTQVTKPDDITVQRFPFKAASVTVLPSAREIGRYDCDIAILPHVQFEGMDVTLRLESRLGK